MSLSLLMLVAPSFLAETEITVDSRFPQPISPYIYGANFPDWPALRTPFTVTRQGGNRMTAYNWETNASNAGSDWKHQNDGYLGESNEPGWTIRQHIESARAHRAVPIVTVPTAGYVSADKKADGDVNQTPNYLATRFFRSLPRKPGGRFAYPPDTADREVYQDEQVAWVERTFGKQGPIWYSLDNEPDIWAATHARIVTKQPGYADIIANNIAFGSAIKAVAPKALIFGPANYGWNGFRTFQGAKDANGRDFLNVYLTAMREAERSVGRRVLDVLDIHWYPEARGGGVRIVDPESKPETAAARIQAPRSLWDPSYVENSWIADSLGKKPITLLPRVKAQIAEHYPGTKLAITEYDFGGGKHASGMLAQAEVLGLYGRYGVFAACHWGIGKEDPAQVAGFRAFLDFDGRGGRFGSLGLNVIGETPSDNMVFAARDAKGSRLTLVVLNKRAVPQTFRLRVPTRSGPRAQAFVQNADRPFAPTAIEASRSPGGVTVTLPPMSVATVTVQ